MRLGCEAGAGLEPRTTAAASALHMTRGYAYLVTKQSKVCKRFDRIAEAHPPRFRDLAVDAEVDLRPLPRAAVGLDLAQRVEVADAGLRVLGRDRAARDLLAEQDDGLADLDAAAEPLVLLVRADAADPDQHPEAPRVDALVAVGAPAELLERCLREHRHGAAAAASVDALPRLLRLHEAHRPADVRRQRLAPRPADEAPFDRATVEVGRHLAVELDLAGDDRAVGERQLEALARRVVGRSDEREPSVPEEAVAPPTGVDDVEATVLGDAATAERDLLELDEGEPLHGRDRQPGDVGHRESLRRRRVDLDLGASRGRLELEDVEVPAGHIHGDVVDRRRRDRALEPSRMGMAVQDKIGAVLGDRDAEPRAAEEGVDAERLALEGVLDGRVVEEDDPQRAVRH